MEVQQAVDSGLSDIRDIVIQDMSDMTHASRFYIPPDLRRTKFSFRRELDKTEKRVRDTFNHDVHTVRGLGSKAISFAKGKERQLSHAVHTDWDKFSSYANAQKNRLEGAVSNGISDVTGWFSKEVDGVENGLVSLMLLGGVLVFVFKNEIGTGAKYLGKSAQSTLNFIGENADKAVYLAPLALL